MSTVTTVANKIPPIRPETAERIAGSTGGDETVWVETQKLDGDKVIDRRREFMTTSDLDRRYDFCREWQGGGRYAMHVFPKNPSDRIRAVDIMIVDVDGPSVSKTQGVKPGAATSTEWPNGYGSQTSTPRVPHDESARLRDEIASLKIALIDERRKNEQEARDNAFRSELQEIRAMLVNKPTQEKSTVSEIATALAPVLSELAKGRKEADQAQMMILAELLKKDHTSPALAAIEQARAEWSRERGELFKLLTESRKEDKYEGMSKMLDASAKMSTAAVATMGTVFDKISQMQGPDEPAWKEPLQKLVDMASSMVSLQVQTATASAQPQQVAAVQEPAQLSAPPDPLLVYRQRMKDILLNGSVWNTSAGKWAVSPVECGFRLFEYADFIRTNDPTDRDVSFFWSDHAAGARRLIGPLLSSKGGEGQRYLEDVIKILPEAFEEWENAEEVDEPEAQPQPQPLGQKQKQAAA